MSAIPTTPPVQPGYLAYGSIVRPRLYQCINCPEKFESASGTAKRCPSCRKAHLTSEEHKRKYFRSEGPYKFGVLTSDGDTFEAVTTDDK